MNYPKFFDNVKSITLYDPLADFLGAFEDGIIEMRYVDIAKFAGHSCPTVAGAYLMTMLGLKKLYPDSTPVRGEIIVDMKGDIREGVTGVIGNVIGFITGAANEGGFKGLAGKFGRANRLRFGANIESEVKLTRIDTNESCLIDYDPSSVPSDPRTGTLMQKMLSGIANDEEKKLFKALWQERVEKILCDENLWENIVKIR
ncbi:FmdE family protein [Nitrosophilus alvini]|uniref:FmdE family protein n=1 Tax=Nitrosophilus alvini TaxID=2714855 RepID=UPI00190C8F2B|nr:FmdE family protein [Nitrosophilus alvini]